MQYLFFLQESLYKLKIEINIELISIMAEHYFSASFYTTLCEYFVFIMYSIDISTFVEDIEAFIMCT